MNQKEEKKQLKLKKRIAIVEEIESFRKRYKIEESNEYLIKLFVPFTRTTLKRTMIKYRFDRSTKKVSTIRSIVPGPPGKKCPMCHGTGRI